MPGFNVAFIPALTGIVKDALIVNNPRLGVFSMGWSDAPQVPGQTVKVLLYGNPGSGAAFDKTSNNYGAGSAPDLDDVTLTFGAPWKLTKTITAEHIKKGAEIQRLINGMVRSLTNDILLDGLSLIKAADFATVAHTGGATTLTADVMAKLASENAHAAGWDPMDRKAMLLSTYYTNLLQDDDLKTASPSDQRQREVGVVQTLSGWTAYNVAGLPANGEKLMGFITDGSGLAIGFAPNASAPGVQEKLDMYEIIKVDGGPTLTVRGIADPYKNEFHLTIESLYAKGVARSTGLQRIVAP